MRNNNSQKIEIVAEYPIMRLHVLMSLVRILKDERLDWNDVLDVVGALERVHKHANSLQAERDLLGESGGTLQATG